MNTSIVYVRTDLWGAKAVQELLTQEKHCLAYANELECKVIKVFRERPWQRSGNGQMSDLLLYLQKNAKQLDCLILQSPGVLARYKMDFLPLLKRIRDFGIRVEFVVYKNKSKKDEKKN